MFVLDDARANEQWDAVANEVRGLLEKHNAEVFSCDRWDERRLAYPIKGRTRAVYLLARFTAPGEALAALERDCQLNETILRVLFTRDIKDERLLKQGLYDPRAADQPKEEEAAEETQAEATAPAAETAAPAAESEETAPTEEAAPAAEEPAPEPAPEAAPAEEEAPESAEPAEEPEKTEEEPPAQS